MIDPKHYVCLFVDVVPLRVGTSSPTRGVATTATATATATTTETTAATTTATT